MGLIKKYYVHICRGAPRFCQYSEKQKHEWTFLVAYKQNDSLQHVFTTLNLWGNISVLESHQ